MSTPLALAIASLAGNPSLNQKQIAKMLNCNEVTVSRHMKAIKQSLASQQVPGAELEQYREQLRKHVPVAKRVKVLNQALDAADTNPFVALRAVDMVDDRLGLTPKSQIQNEISNDTRPMFILPGDAKVQLNVQVNNTYPVNPVLSNEKK